MSYSYLKNEKSPRILIEALKYLGVKEIVGTKHNPVILNWAKELDIENVYNSDEIAWCGLFMAYVCHKAGLETGFTNQQSLWALNWNKFGAKTSVAMLGDVLTFKRKSGGHVGIYVGEDDACYHVLGGNQNNSVSIVRIEKTRISQIRRTKWKIKQPDNVRVVKLENNGKISENES
jgi:uncharacterized protein (TIGR02594 family)